MIVDKSYFARGFPSNWMTPRLHAALTARQVEFATTSGTTSDRMQVIRKKDWWQDEYRRTYRYNPRMVDFEVGTDHKALLTTAICSNTVCYLEQAPYDDRILNNALYLNTTADPNQWRKSDLERMCGEIARFQPIYIDADPAYLTLFLHLCAVHGVTVPYPLPRYITLSYEMTTQFCRRYIQARWPVPTYDLYGATEIGYLYLQADDGTLTRSRDLSLVELAPYNVEHDLYYLIVTSVKNEYMPLIRYRIGDLVKVPGGRDHIAAKSSHDDVPIAYFCGRAGDVRRAKSGRPITAGDVDHALSPATDQVLLYQITVLADDEIVFRYVPVSDQELSRGDRETLTQCLVDIFGSPCHIRFTRERAIAPEISGKFATLK
ncbi:MAG: hypothetical protein MJE77_04615 [Proteobacteria bacterium]|nr:hypothetical protein [Pseudomonadota bacterium]